MSAFGGVQKRQLLFVVATLGSGLVATYFFGFLIGFALNIGLLVALTFYIRAKRAKALKSFGFSSEALGGGFASGANSKLKYACLSCGAEMTGSRCARCGSSMKKPIF